MALEISLLNQNVICELLGKNYGIFPISVQKLKLGSANCYRVFDGEKYYFLKEFQSFFSEDQIIREARLLEFLSSSDIPTAQFYKTLNGEYVIKYQDRLICLQNYIEGVSYGYYDLPSDMLPLAARMLGKIHNALKDYDLPEHRSGEWISSFCAEDVIRQYDSLIEIAKKKSDDKNTLKIIADLEYKKQLSKRLEEYKKYNNGITYSSTHGDYQGCQLIFDDDQIKAVVDFSSAHKLPVVWEVMRSFVQSSSECRDSASIDIQGLCSYVQEYMKFFSLTETDLRSMPYVYLFQLGRSKFGYKQYLNSTSEDRKDLLNFAFWRTKMCREVEEKANLISSELLKLIK